MRPPISALLSGGLAVALLSLSACGSGSEDPAATPTTTPTSAATASASDSPSTAPVTEAALSLEGDQAFGYCANVRKHPGDFVWSGPQFTAVSDATIEEAGPLVVRDVRVIGAWLVEDARDDGVLAPWGERPSSLRKPMTEAQGAAAVAGTTYRLVLRLRAQQLPAQLSDTTISYTSAGNSGTLNEGSTIRFKKRC